MVLASRCYQRACGQHVLTWLTLPRIVTAPHTHHSPHTVRPSSSLNVVFTVIDRNRTTANNRRQYRCNKIITDVNTIIINALKLLSNRIMFVRSHFHKIMWTDCYEFCTQTQRRKRHLTTKCERDRSMAKVMTFCEVCNHHIRKLHVFRKDTCTKILWFEIRNLLFELRQKSTMI